MKEILIVDDDGETLAAMVELLGDAGYAASGATSAAEALRRAKSARPDLLVIDLLMPGMDGFELIARLDQDPELARVPRVAMTAWPRPLELPQGTSLLKKPFEWDTLLRVVRLHCGEVATLYGPSFGADSKAEALALAVS